MVESFPLPSHDCNNNNKVFLKMDPFISTQRSWSSLGEKEGFDVARRADLWNGLAACFPAPITSSLQLYFQSRSSICHRPALSGSMTPNRHCTEENVGLRSSLSNFTDRSSLKQPAMQWSDHLADSIYYMRNPTRTRMLTEALVIDKMVEETSK